MKSKYFTLLAVMSILFSTSCSQKEDLEGTWLLVKGTYITENNTLNYPVSEGERRIKVLTKTHFATVWQNPIDDKYSGYNGGTYTFENGFLTESLEFFHESKFVGTKSYFKISFEGDHIKMTSCDAMGRDAEYGYFEEWQKIE